MLVKGATGRKAILGFRWRHCACPMCHTRILVFSSFTWDTFHECLIIVGNKQEIHLISIWPMLWVNLPDKNIVDLKQCQFCCNLVMIYVISFCVGIKKYIFVTSNNNILRIIFRTEVYRNFVTLYAVVNLLTLGNGLLPNYTSRIFNKYWAIFNKVFKILKWFYIN